MPDEPHNLQALLVARCQAGDRAALEELIRQWERRLLYYVRRLVEREVDAWDVLQQTWIAVLRSIGGLRDPALLRPWLYRLARNTAASHYRPELAQRRHLDPEADLQEVEAADWAPAFDEAQRVHDALGKLTLPHREVLTLHFLEEMSVEEIALVVGAPAGTVKSRLHYAKKALRVALTAEECRHE